MPLSKKKKTMIIFDPISGNRIILSPPDKPRSRHLSNLLCAPNETDPSGKTESRSSGADKVRN
ncbi:hypothetical protein [Microvirga sp. VF16]|uniref:hypothetical protein n=1 Tax=Microvirga sp. VF16 TaxID=2807101 RepID=UPI00193C8B2E|nr:hypothetical protein [Microvirga sp. VF16]QRM29347.1 hypothetical protein JO965_24810 [Microvirga sp. VF16]